MGKGDKKSKKGKNFRKSHGNTRPKRKTVKKLLEAKKRLIREEAAKA